MGDGSRDSYPLAALIEVRSREEDECKQALALAVQAAADARAEVERCQEAADGARTALRAFANAAAERAQAGLAVRDMMADQAYRQRLEAAVAEADAAVAAAAELAREKDEVEQTARDTLAAARAETRAVESHRERWQQERRRERERKAEDAADDMAQARWRRDK